MRRRRHVPLTRGTADAQNTDLAPGVRPRRCRSLALALPLHLLLAAPLLAIPSPDVVVNLFASAAQVLGLATVLLGSCFFAGRGRPRASRSLSGAVAVSSRWPFRVALLLLAISLGANVLQYTGSLDERNRRLRVNLVRSSKENGKRVGDTSLRTLGLSAQLDHPRGIASDELARLLEEAGSPQAARLLLVDAREPEEVAAGRIAGSEHHRYPDLLEDPERINAGDSRIVFLCYSGNRSSELSDEFKKLDIETHFLIGGYEKWIAEGRPLVDRPARGGRELREIADYPGRDRLLDTPEVERLVREEEAVFVDVRYEGDFETHSLPAAHNIPIRRLPTPEMWDRLGDLPRKPIIAPCYDKRSSFYAMILGARLTRLGYDYRGRYTVPHEYHEAAVLRPHVARWEAENDRSLMAMASAPMGRLLAWLDDHLGHLALAILISVLLLRLALLPLTVKADRDQIVLRDLAPEIDELRRKTGEDRPRFSRALLELHRKHRITAGRNLVGSTAQIVIFLLFFAAVNDVAAGSGDSFLWIPSLALADPLLLLPGALAGLIFVHLQVNAVKRQRRYLALRLLASGTLFAITFKLRAALNLYLLLNVFLMALQNRLVRRFLRRSNRVDRCRPLPPRGVVPLGLAHRVPGTGNKAIRLAQMKVAGLPVPDGFVITTTLLASNGLNGNGLHLPLRERRRISRLLRSIGAEKVAVRSSGLNEDGNQKSYAGVFESILNVRRGKLYDALAEVHESLNSARASAYNGNGREAGGILVQSMVDAEYAGVLFTEHPAESGSMLVEMIEGLGEALVSGTATPRGYRFGRVSGQPLDDEAPPIDLSALVELGRGVERLFGEPQDVEWAYADGEFILLQSRHITRLSHSGTTRDCRQVIEGERHRLLRLLEGAPSGEVVLAQNELSELLPRPTPLSLSFMERLWSPGGSTDLACRVLGIPYRVTEDGAPYVNTVFGALYINRMEERRRLSRGAGAVASFRLSRAADGLEREFREDFLPAFLREVAHREIMDLSRLSPAELIRLFGEWSDQFISRTYVHAELINIAADFYMKIAEKQLRRRGLAPAAYLCQCSGTVVHRALSLLPAIREGRKPVSRFLEVFGHRALHDYELAEPRYVEDPSLVEALAARATAASGPEEGPDLPDDALLGLAVERARRFQVLKEDAKHHSLRELALLRKILVELGNLLGIAERIFLLTVDEIPGLAQPGGAIDACLRAADREVEREIFQDLQLPPELTVTQIESMAPDGTFSNDPAPRANEEMRGLMVAGNREVQGRARVVNVPDDIDDFQEGDVLVARFTNPSWTPLFSKASGIITEVGGWLSHAAILAREYNVPTVVGVRGALGQISTGDTVRLHLDGSIRSVPGARETETAESERTDAFWFPGEKP